MTSSKAPTVDVSVYGKFAAHRLAAELEKAGALHRLYTSYPRAVDGVPSEHLKNYSALKVLERLCLETVGRFGLQERVWELFGDTYDAIVAKVLEPSDLDGGKVLHAMASQSLKSIRRASSIGYRTFVDSACPHPAFKMQLLTEEAELMGERFRGSQRWVDAVSAECDAADRIVVPSIYSYNSFVDLGYPADKVVQVPLGVDAAEITPRLSNSTSWTPERPFTVLMVGTSALRKGAFYLLSAWERLRLRNARLIIRCDIPARAKPYTRIAGVEIVAAVPRRELVRLYEKSTVFCFPSVDDGFGLVVLEAMAAGLPVVTTRHVGASELITQGQEGFVVPIRDIDAIAESLQRLYDNPTLTRRMGEAARQLALQYTWKRYGATMIAAYIATAS